MRLLTPRRVLLVAAVLLVGIVGWRIVVMRRAANKIDNRVEEVTLVQTARVERADLAEKVSFTGTIRPRNEVDVFAKVSGRIETLAVQIGDRVRSGRVLAVIEHKEVGWQAKAAQAAVEVARANLEGARLDFERTQALFQGGSGTQAQLDGARVRLGLAQAQLVQAEAAAGLANQQLRNATIESPIDGTVIRRHVNLGTQVGPQTVLFTLQDVAHLKLEASVDAVAFARLAAGQDVLLTVDALPGETFRGKLTLRSPALDAVTRRAAIEIEIDNTSGRLMPNMFAHADVIVGQLENVLALPKAALLEVAGGLVAFRLRNDSLQMVRPQLGASDGSMIMVRHGLDEGDEVVVGALETLADGMAVKANEAKPQPATVERRDAEVAAQPGVARRAEHEGRMQ